MSIEPTTPINATPVADAPPPTPFVGTNLGMALDEKADTALWHKTNALEKKLRDDLNAICPWWTNATITFDRHESASAALHRLFEGVRKELKGHHRAAYAGAFLRRVEELSKSVDSIREELDSLPR